MIAGLVGIFVIFSIWLRVLPMLSMGHTDVLSLVGSDDPLYNLRQVEQLLTNHFTYTWFDPMTQYPVGSNVYWGPLFIYISGFACWIAGATTRPEIISVCLLVPVAMAAITVVLMYYVGKICGDWKTGLLASGFTAVVTGQFFYRSLYGYFDHHIGEVLFSTLFCLVYLYILISEKDAPIDLKNFTTWKKTALLSVLAGIAYLLGLFLMPTMIVFALMVVLFTVIQFIIGVYREKPGDYILITNTVIFTVAIIGLLLFGFKSPGLDLSNYSVGHVYAYLAIIAGTGVLYLLVRYLKGKPKYYYPVSLVGLAVIGAVVLHVTGPQFFDQLVNAAVQFFGQAPVTNTVQEARGWSLAAAWTTFNYGLILMAGGMLVILYSIWREDRPHEVFTLVWSAIIFYSTCQHIRYEYYLAVNVALLSAICVSFVYEWGREDLSRLLAGFTKSAGLEEPSGKSDDLQTRRKKQKKAQKQDPGLTPARYTVLALVIITAGLGILFAYTSASYSYINASGNPLVMNQDWKDSLIWMANNTPSTGVDYYTIYDKSSFVYPNTSYGVMSWWDYGHMITYIAQRIPNANPFQAGVSGPDGSAAYFMATNESTANTILDHDGTRYVITDIEMDTGKFWAMATWFNPTIAAAPYQMTVLIPGQTESSGYQSASLNEAPYYETMVSKLHNFDGSMASATAAYYVEYADSNVTHISYPVLTNAEAMDVSAATTRAAQYNQNAPAGYHATVLSSSVVLPLTDIPALQHYRLVHESSTSELTTNKTDVKYVKIFEYVKGAHIKGSGIIDLPVVTNTGRNFTYRQQSVDGEFIVPYSTTGNPYDVKATGSYQIEGTGQTFDVPESAVMQGLTIN
ncbi:oligosaccharyl transferase, archaeosortase A system-associated [Methanoregula sp.]|uniref:oligosaccharyl transferase, archaeosortase A system-associated n=1 Tax=Methanoregula sp. TaxID=2052170 RepID=UPI002C7429EB|nr:oligosaccharyl transferase, archaeosortase A system-associated [Methanoregula sp.]HVP96561.1 oligosaccharyl transferase, archaeosortase A system-associated [Methanoregula sp.]